MKNLAFDGSLKWKMIILPILTSSLIHFLFSLGGWENVLLELRSERVDTFIPKQWSAVALTHVSVYSMHKNLAVCKIMEAMHTAYCKKKKRDSVSAHLKQNMKQHTRVCESNAHIVCEEHLHSLNSRGALEMRHLFLYFFLLVHIYEFLYVNFSPTCVWCMHLLKS